MPGDSTPFFWGTWNRDDLSDADKIRLRDAVVTASDPQCDDEMLDLGSGHGLVAIGLARGVGPGGRATVWGVGGGPSEASPSRSIDLLCANAQAAGVVDRIRPLAADIRNLPLPAESIDRAASLRGLENLEGEGDFQQALAETYRVLVTGGRLVLLERVDRPDSYTTAIRAAGFTIDSDGPAPILGNPYRMVVLRAVRDSIKS